MVVDERARIELHQRLEEVLGGEAAMTLMEHLPPGGSTKVATKRDLGGFEQRLGQRIDGLGQRIDGLEQRIDGLEHRFDGVDRRMDQIDRRLDRFDQRLDRFDQRMDGFHHELVRQTRIVVFAVLAALATNTSVALAAAQFN